MARSFPRINHLLFADDTMFFIRADQRSCAALSSILSRYEAASGQAINTSKSSISFSKKTPSSIIEAAKGTLNIHQEGGVGKYLGLPKHFGRKKRDLFSSIVDKIKQKASGWSNRYLSTVGKFTMLKSVLSPIPSYAMTCFQLPVSLCKWIQSALTRFFWDARNGSRKMAWISWKKLTKSKAEGGLGFRDFQCFNIAFLAKLSWRLIHYPHSLLGRTLLGKYDPENDFMQITKRSSDSHGWRGILVGKDLIAENSGWIVGDGKSINIWTDPLLSCSRREAPMGPPPEELVKYTVADLFLPNSVEWDRQKIHRILPQWEDKILSIKTSALGAPDKLAWIHSKTGDYSTKSGYWAAMQSRTEPENNIVTPTVN